jgi:hypothetical protein
VLILAAIIALGASGVILMMLAIANPIIDDDASDSPAASNAHARLRVITRTDGVPLARRHARPAVDVRRVVTREQEPPRRSATRKSWWRRRRDATNHGYPRTGLRGTLASPDARFVAGSVACSLAIGLFIAHLSV